MKPNSFSNLVRLNAQLDQPKPIQVLAEISEAIRSITNPGRCVRLSSRRHLTYLLAYWHTVGIRGWNWVTLLGCWEPNWSSFRNTHAAALYLQKDASKWIHPEMGSYPILWQLQVGNDVLNRKRVNRFYLGGRHDSQNCNFQMSMTSIFSSGPWAAWSAPARDGKQFLVI